MKPSIFNNIYSKAAAWLRLRRDVFINRKTHKYVRCPQCRRISRVPRGKGRLRITCPACAAVFEKVV